MWLSTTFRLLTAALFLSQTYLAVQALPQGDSSSRAQAPKVASQQSSQPNHGAVLSIFAKFGNYALPHISNPRHRPFCDLNLDDSQVCPTNQACVEDPWSPEALAISTNYRNQRSNKIGVCASAASENMCAGFAGTSRTCQNSNDGWQCSKPSRCDRENISDCDWLCVQPPPASLVGGKGFQWTS
jgi:hypothetical protein